MSVSLGGIRGKYAIYEFFKLNYFKRVPICICLFLISFRNLFVCMLRDSNCACYETELNITKNRFVENK